MPTRVLVDNLASQLVPSGLGNFPVAETGYGNGDPFVPEVGHAWLSDFAAASYTWNLDLGSSKAADFVAAFDVRGLTKGVAQVTSVELYTGSAITGPWTLRATVDPNTRGDGCTAFTSVSSRYWRIVVVMVDGTDHLRVGAFAFGPRLDLPAQWRSRRRDPGHRTRVNESPTRTFTSRRATRREELELAWPPIRESNLPALEALVDSTEGAMRAFILQPRSSDNTVVFHGRIEDEFPTELEPDEIVYGARYLFRESGRAL